MILDLEVTQELEEILELPGLKVHLGHKEIQGCKDLLDQQDYKAHQDQMVLLEILDNLGQEVILVLRDLRASLEIKVPQGLLAHKDHPGLKVRQDREVTLDHKELREAMD